MPKGVGARWGQKQKGNHKEECGGPLGAESSLWLLVLKKQGPQSYNPKKLNSATNQNEFSSGFSPRATRNESKLVAP